MQKTFTPSGTCPWWLLFTFDNPLRRLVHDPQKILAPYVQPGVTALDVGCGMGYFTLSLAQLVGPDGSVIAADLQQAMLDGLVRRARGSGLLERIQLVHSTAEKIGIEQPVDFALAFWMVHEVRQPESFLEEIYAALKPGGRLLVVEPKIHVRAPAFENTVCLAQKRGFSMVARPQVWGSRAVLFQK